MKQLIGYQCIGHVRSLIGARVYRLGPIFYSKILGYFVYVHVVVGTKWDCFIWKKD